jgi:hypothetical protein
MVDRTCGVGVSITRWRQYLGIEVGNVSIAAIQINICIVTIHFSKTQRMYQVVSRGRVAILGSWLKTFLETMISRSRDSDITPL